MIREENLLFKSLYAVKTSQYSTFYYFKNA